MELRIFRPLYLKFSALFTQIEEFYVFHHIFPLFSWFGKCDGEEDANNSQESHRGSAL